MPTDPTLVPQGSDHPQSLLFKLAKALEAGGGGGGGGGFDPNAAVVTIGSGPSTTSVHIGKITGSTNINEGAIILNNGLVSIAGAAYHTTVSIGNAASTTDFNGTAWFGGEAYFRGPYAELAADDIAIGGNDSNITIGKTGSTTTTFRGTLNFSLVDSFDGLPSGGMTNDAGFANSLSLSGTGSSVGGTKSVALGISAVASEARAVVVGTEASAGADSAVFGYHAGAGGGGVAAGTEAYAGSAATGIGYSAKAYGVRSTAIGNTTTAASLDSVVIGSGAYTNSDNDDTVVVGNNAGSSTGSTYSVVVGKSASNSFYSGYSVAVGHSAAVDNSHTIAIGASSYVSGTGGISVGFAATAGRNSISIGRDANNGFYSSYANCFGYATLAPSEGESTFGYASGNPDHFGAVAIRGGAWSSGFHTYFAMSHRGTAPIAPVDAYNAVRGGFSYDELPKGCATIAIDVDAVKLWFHDYASGTIKVATLGTLAAV